MYSLDLCALKTDARSADIDCKVGVIKTVLLDPGAVFHFRSPSFSVIIIEEDPLY